MQIWLSVILSGKCLTESVCQATSIGHKIPCLVKLFVDVFVSLISQYVDADTH